MTEARPFHVLVEVDRARFHTRLREIEAWLAEWHADAEIGSVLGIAGQLRIRFADERAAYAFRRCLGGVAAPAHKMATAQASDEGLYDHLAREYPDST